MTRRHGHTSYGLDVGPADTWHRRALCAQVPFDDAPLSNSHDEDLSCLICRGCPVQRQCLAEGVAFQDWETVRGGLSGKERERAHLRGLTPAQYPPHQPVTHYCQRCSARYTPTERRQRICQDCRSHEATREARNEYRRDWRASRREPAHV